MSENRCDVYVTRKIRPEGLELLAHACASKVWEGPEDAGPSQATVLGAVKNTKVLLSLLTETIDRKILEANPNLLGVANYAVGFNNIDVGAATQLGIPVTNTPGVLTETTADLAWVLLMATARCIPAAHQYMVEERYKIWGPNLFLGGDIGKGPSGEVKTLGIIGYGRIGQAVHRRATGFDMRVIAFDPEMKAMIEKTPGVEYRDLGQLLAESDFVSLHCNLTEKTKHLIGAKEFKAMKKSAYLINTARGPIVDEKALVQALKNNDIAGAGLDVYEDEPAMAAGLKDLPNAVLLPHIASASLSTRAEMARMAARNALALLKKDRGPNTVNPEVYESAAYQERMKRG